MQNKFCAAAAAAALATVLSLMAGSALAQSTPDTGEPGKPLSLLQMLVHHGTPKKPEARVAAKPEPRAHVAARTGKTEARSAARSTHRWSHVAARHKEPARGTEHKTAANAAAAPVPAAPWPLGQMPAPEAAPAAQVAAVAPTEPVPADPAPAAAEAQVSELVVGGHTVQIASPDQVNAIDLAADADQQDQKAAPGKTADAQTPPNAMTTQNEDADDPQTTDGDGADAADAQAAPRQVVAFAREADGASHHSSWLAELLATLGGALAAGSVAWFLIGSAPQRA